MSTHNVCFYGEISKIIFQLSSNSQLICSSENLLPWSTDCLTLKTQKLNDGSIYNEKYFTERENLHDSCNTLFTCFKQFALK